MVSCESEAPILLKSENIVWSGEFGSGETIPPCFCEIRDLDSLVTTLYTSGTLRLD